MKSLRKKNQNENTKYVNIIHQHTNNNISIIATNKESFET